MTNQEKFIQIFGIDAWRQMIISSGLAEQFRNYWTSPYNEPDCRDCKEFEDCPCGKDGHESGTSQGYSTGECKDFKPQERMKAPEEKITYSAICEQMPIPHLYFGTYEEAEDYAKFEQPAYRPYYIVERVEHFEICGVVEDKGRK